MEIKTFVTFTVINNLFFDEEFLFEGEEVTLNIEEFSECEYDVNEYSDQDQEIETVSVRLANGKNFEINESFEAFETFLEENNLLIVEEYENNVIPLFSEDQKVAC